mgnify:CR=1 FL=1
MKIMQVMAGAEFGGAEEFFTRLCVALSETSISQRVVLRKNEKRSRRLRDGGIDPLELNFGGKLDFYTPWVLKREINSFAPDILFSWMNRATSMCPKVRDFVHLGRMGGYYNLKYYDQCDHLIANTEDIKAYIIRNGWSPSKVDYLPNFVDIHESKPLLKKTFYTPENAPLILAMGRFHENKAFDILLDALSKVPDAYLWIAGDGPLKAEMEGYAEKLGVKPRTRFLGWHNDVGKLLSSADIFVCPSRHEPLGNVIIEAWGHNIPVISAASQGPNVLINNDINGILFPIDDSKTLAREINRLINEPIVRSILSENGQKTYENNFSKEIVVKKSLEFFERMLT